MSRVVVVQLVEWLLLTPNHNSCLLNCKGTKDQKKEKEDRNSPLF